MLNKQMTQLPEPTLIAKAHSDQLVQHILQAINKQNGKILFADFMRLALYAPGLGYYSAGAKKFGASGDFITAPELSPLFSYCLAKQCTEVFKEMPDGNILELGAGSGKMATDILSYLQSIDCLPKKYFILEVSADLKQRQQQLLTSHHPELINRVIWLDALPENFNGIILANEVLDAIPVNFFHWDKDQLQEYYVSYKGDKFVWQLDDASHSLTSQFNALKNNLDISNWQIPYTSEINTLLPAWIQSIGDCLDTGIIFFIDYGFPQSVYYHPQRNRGTLMCHYQHRAHTDPLILVGLQDITAHVDFTAVTQSATENGLLLEGFVTQGNFLVNCKIDQLIEAIADRIEKHHTNQSVKKLMLPTEMGEIFKVIGFSKQLETELSGFSKFDISHKL